MVLGHEYKFNATASCTDTSFSGLSHYLWGKYTLITRLMETKVTGSGLPIRGRSLTRANAGQSAGPVSQLQPGPGRWSLRSPPGTRRTAEGSSFAQTKAGTLFNESSRSSLRRPKPQTVVILKGRVKGDSPLKDSETDPVVKLRSSTEHFLKSSKPGTQGAQLNEVNQEQLRMFSLCAVRKESPPPLITGSCYADQDSAIAGFQVRVHNTAQLRTSEDCWRMPIKSSGNVPISWRSDVFSNSQSFPVETWP